MFFLSQHLIEIMTQVIDKIHTYTDTATHTLQARNFNWQWQGTDGSNTSHTSSIGS